MTVEVIIAGIVGTLIGGLIVFLGALVQSNITSITNRISRLEQENHDLIERFETQEEIKNKLRQSGATIAGIENVQAALMRIKYQRLLEDELLEASCRTLGQMRKGPYAFDPETPSVQRKDYPID